MFSPCPSPWWPLSIFLKRPHLLIISLPPMLSYTITIKRAFWTEETNTDKDWVSSTSMDVHSVMAQSSGSLCRISRGRRIFSCGLVPDHPGLAWLLLHPPMSASQSVSNIRFVDIHENDAFCHNKIRDGQNFVLISQYGSFFCFKSA